MHWERTGEMNQLFGYDVLDTEEPIWLRESKDWKFWKPTP